MQARTLSRGSRRQVPCDGGALREGRRRTRRYAGTSSPPAGDVRLAVPVLPPARGVPSDRLEGGGGRGRDRDVLPRGEAGRGLDPRPILRARGRPSAVRYRNPRLRGPERPEASQLKPLDSSGRLAGALQEKVPEQLPALREGELMDEPRKKGFAPESGAVSMSECLFTSTFLGNPSEDFPGTPG